MQEIHIQQINNVCVHSQAADMYTNQSVQKYGWLCITILIVSISIFIVGVQGERWLCAPRPVLLALEENPPAVR